MRPAQYFYISPNKRITINCTQFWTWFLDDDQRNDISVNCKKELLKILSIYR